MRLTEFTNIKLQEGGNVFPGTVDIKKEYVPGIVDQLTQMLPDYNLQPHIGSAGYKVVSGDMDVMLDAQEVISHYNAKDEKDAKQQLAKDLRAKTGLEVSVKGRNVHLKMPLPDKTFGQVDLMVIADASIVAPYHQHGPRGSYDDPEFKGSDIFIVMNSIAKSLGLKFDAFGAKLMRRDDNFVVARDRDEVSKILLNPGAKGDDLNSVKSILNALKTDPKRDEKLAQARDDAAKGIVKLPGDAR